VEHQRGVIIRKRAMIFPLCLASLGLIRDRRRRNYPRGRFRDAWKHFAHALVRAFAEVHPKKSFVPQNARFRHVSVPTYVKEQVTAGKGVCPLMLWI
jgi:hypothetical protein